MKAFKATVRAEAPKIQLEIDLGAIIDGGMATSFSNYSRNSNVARFSLRLKKAA
jgi:hypothetical protein